MMVTRHKKLEQVDMHCRTILTCLSSIIGIRETSSVIFTNFVCLLKYDGCSEGLLRYTQDMLHASILPHEELWRGCVYL